MRRSTMVTGVLVLLIAVVLMLVAALGRGDGSVSGPPLDPRSTAPDGTRALVLLLEGLGVEVELVGRVEELSGDRILLLSDRLSGAERAELTDRVDGGARLVVADPGSPLSPGPAGAVRPGVTGSCPLVEGVDELVGELVPLAVDEGDEQCWEVGSGAVLVVSGARVALGGAGPLLNANIAEGDGAVLAVRLLGDADRVEILDPVPPVGSGEETLVDLVPDGVWGVLVQLAVLGVVAAATAARRFGPPVPDPPVITVEGSTLTRSTARLLAEAGGARLAADWLRDDVRPLAAARLGLDPSVGDGPLSVLMADRLQMSELEVNTALRTEVVDEADLAEVARAVRSVRAHLLGRAETALSEPAGVSEASLTSAPGGPNPDPAPREEA